MLPSVSDARRLQTPLAVSSFQTPSFGRTLVQPWWNLYQSKVLLLSFLSISMMAAFDKQKSWIKLFEMYVMDFVLFVDHRHCHKKYWQKDLSFFFRVILKWEFKTIHTSNTQLPKCDNKEILLPKPCGQLWPLRRPHKQLCMPSWWILHCQCSTLPVIDLVDE